MKNKDTRRAAREWAMQFLYQIDIFKATKEEIEAALANFYEQLSNVGFHESKDAIDKDFLRSAFKQSKRFIAGVIEHCRELDDKLSSLATDWNIHRMDLVDKNIMRIAIFEMLYCEDIPPVVSIDEAVAVGKEFGSTNTPSFVNGVLNSLKDTLDRPARKSNI